MRQSAGHDKRTKPQFLDPSGLEAPTKKKKFSFGVDGDNNFPTSSINVDEVVQDSVLKIAGCPTIIQDRNKNVISEKSEKYLANAAVSDPSGEKRSVPTSLEHANHSTEVTADLHGNYLPLDLRGAESIPASETNIVSFTEHTQDSCHSRPLSSRKFRAVCFGNFLTAEAVRRANFKVVFAASAHNRRAFWSHLGVNAFGSPESLIKIVPRDMTLAAFSCDSAEEFERITAYLSRDKVAAFFFDTSPEWFSMESETETKNSILEALADAGYVIKCGATCARSFGVCASLERGQIIGLRKDIATVVDFKSGKLPQGPITNVEVKHKCVADLIEERRAEVESDQIDLDEWIASRPHEGWVISWCEGMEEVTKADHSDRQEAIRRIDAISEGRPITLGYLHKEGEPIRKEPGFLIAHVYGLLHEPTDPTDDSGPGQGSSFYWDPLTDKMTTLSTGTLKRIWHIEELCDVEVDGLRNVSHPLVSCTSMELLALYLDKYFSLSKTVPPTPRIRFRCITDVYTPEALAKIKSWTRRVEKWTTWTRKTKQKSSAPKPLVMGDEALQFWARGWNFEIKDGVPTRTERRSRPRHSINLRYLPMMENYDDLDILIIADLIGFACGSNPATKVVLHANDCGFVANEEEALKTFKTDLHFGWATFSENIPHCPIWCSPHFLIWQATKWRRIYNYSKAVNGMSINQQRAFFKSAALELVSLKWLSKELLIAAKKIVLLRERGISAVCFLFVVDLFKAYNQLCVDVRDQWHTCSTVVDEEGTLKFVELLVTAFGPQKAPMVFSRVTRAANYSMDQQLKSTKKFPLQTEYRKLLKRDEKTTRESSSYGSDGLPILTKRVPLSKETKGARDLNALLPEWECDDEVKAVLPDIQLLRPGPSVSTPDIEKLYALATYLDDCFGHFIVSNAMGGRRPHSDGQVRSNSNFVRKDKGAPAGSATGAERAEQLRRSFVRGTFEKAGLVVVSEGDKRSTRKWLEGKCALVMKILGVILDVTDPQNPTIALPEDKRKELNLLILTCLSNTNSEGQILVRVGELQSILGKLSNATKACKRGRVYLCGLFKSLRLPRTSCHEDTILTLEPWQKRNLVWWAKRTEVEWKPEEVFERIPSIEKKWCGHSDAATGVGYGGFFNRKGGHKCRLSGEQSLEGGFENNRPTEIIQVEDTCYYIKGEWTNTERELMETPTEELGGKRLGINFLEMATVGMLISASKAVGFEDNCSTFYCDNETTVKVLNSYKTRTLPLASLLENIDLECSDRNLDFDYQWIATKSNIESDLLSRGMIAEFKEYIRKTYNIYKFVELQVSDDARKMGHVCENARRNPHWIVPDGASKEGLPK